MKGGIHSYPYIVCIGVYTSAVTVTEAVSKSDIAHCWSVEGLTLQHRRSPLRKGHSSPRTPQYRTQQGLNTDSLLWQAVTDTRYAILTPLLHFRDPSRDQATHLPSQLPPFLVRTAALIHLWHSSAHNYFRNFYFSSRMNLFSHSTNNTAISSLSTWFFKRDCFYIWADCVCSGGGTRLLEIGDKTSVHTQISTRLLQRAYSR